MAAWIQHLYTHLDVTWCDCMSVSSFLWLRTSDGIENVVHGGCVARRTSMTYEIKGTMQYLGTRDVNAVEKIQFAGLAKSSKAFPTPSYWQSAFEVAPGPRWCPENRDEVRPPSQTYIFFISMCHEILCKSKANSSPTEMTTKYHSELCLQKINCEQTHSSFWCNVHSPS